MKSIILAAGYGTRLGEIGEKLPKGLIETENSTLVGRVVSELRSSNIEEIAIVTNNKYYPAYKSWAESEKQEDMIKLLNDGTTAPENRLGALGDLLFAINELGWQDEDILVAPSDTFFAFPLSKFLEFVNSDSKSFATIVREMAIQEIKNRLGCAVVSPDGEITNFTEKPENPPSVFAAIPFYYYPAGTSSLLIQYMNEKNSSDAPGSIIPWLLKKNIKVRAFRVIENTIDVGTVKELHILSSLGKN
jgi:glucose-1-phosphate thymidylyltransferase